MGHISYFGDCANRLEVGPCLLKAASSEHHFSFEVPSILFTKNMFLRKRRRTHGRFGLRVFDVFEAFNSSGEERRGTYHFDVSTGKLTEADETILGQALGPEQWRKGLHFWKLSWKWSSSPVCSGRCSHPRGACHPVP